MRHRREVEMTMSEMWKVASEPAPRRHRFVAFLALLATIVAGGLGLSLVSMPAASVVGAQISNGDAYWNSLPSKLDLNIKLSEPTVLLDRNGQEFARFYAEDRTTVTLDKVAPVMTSALLAVEDDRFYQHAAMDFKGFSRAALVNLISDRTQGGSTLTQQLVENIRVAEAGNDPVALRQAHATTLEGKIQELKYAVTLEQNYTKDQILEQYLNTVYFGNGAYGVEAAAQRFYGVHASDLNLAQAALLAGLMKSPTDYDPVKHPQKAHDRRATVLARMVETKRITQAQADEADAAPVGVTIASPPNGCQLSAYAAYCAYVRDQLLEDPVFGADASEREANLYRGGLVIKTALDRSISDKAQAAVNAAFTPDNRVAAAEAVVEPGTGLVPALVQSKPYGQGENQTEIVYATRPAFQPGSSFKMFTLATALEQGFDPSLKLSAPTGYKPAHMDAPKDGFSNEGKHSFGAIDMRFATRDSVNVYFIKLIEKTGVMPVVEMARRLGITSIPTDGPHAPTPRSATLTLGAWEVAPLEMSAAYASIAANGVYCKPTGIISAQRSRDGSSVEVPDSACHQAISPEVAKTLSSILTEPLMKGGTAAGLGLDRPAAGKTGTTNDYAATWFIGFTPQYAAGVWVGDPRGGSAYPLEKVTAYGHFYPHLFGATVAAPIWHDSMMAFHEGLPQMELGSLNLSVGPLKVKELPDVRGMSSSQAFTMLLASGYKVEVSQSVAAPDPLLGPNLVSSQSPAPGSSVPQGSSVILTLTAGSDTNVTAPQPPQEGSAK